MNINQHTRILVNMPGPWEVQTAQWSWASIKKIIAH